MRTGSVVGARPGWKRQALGTDELTTPHRRLLALSHVPHPCGEGVHRRARALGCGFVPTFLPKVALLSIDC